MYFIFCLLLTVSHLQRQQWKMVVVSPRSRNSKKKKKRRRRNKWNNREMERMYTHSLTPPKHSISLSSLSLSPNLYFYTCTKTACTLYLSLSLSSSCSLFLVSVSCYHCYWITDVHPFWFLINYYFTHSLLVRQFWC